jgi:exodeoxyribonuclease-3
MKIATFNINNVNRRLPNLLRWLRAAKPDVVALQELKSTDGDFPIDAISKAGYGAAWRGQKTWNGVAILARKADPVLIRTALPGDPDDNEALHRSRRQRHRRHQHLPSERQSAAGAEIRLQARLVQAAQIARREIRQAGYSGGAGGRLQRRADRIGYLSDAVMGQGCVDPAEDRAAFKSLVAQGWTDAIRQLHPEKPIYTFWDYKRNRWPRDAGLRLDHLLLSPVIAPRLIKAGVDRKLRGEEGASDHAPAWIVLR